MLLRRRYKEAPQVNELAVAVYFGLLKNGSAPLVFDNNIWRVEMQMCDYPGAVFDVIEDQHSFSKAEDGQR